MEIPNGQKKVQQGREVAKKAAWIIQWKTNKSTH